MVQRQARDMEVRVSNPGPGTNFSLEFKMITLCFPGAYKIGGRSNESTWPPHRSIERGVNTRDNRRRKICTD